jgi:CheY-like chemotaxis protein
VVVLPILASARPPRCTPARPVGPSAREDAACLRILVVDDHVDAATSLARLLSLLGGHEVEVAHDGSAALELVRSFRPQLAILDIGMPGMDGYEVARRLRAEDEFAPLKLVALTGWGQDGDRQRSRAAGFDVHLVKPVDPRELLDLVAGAGRRGPGA